MSYLALRDTPVHHSQMLPLLPCGLNCRLAELHTCGMNVETRNSFDTDKHGFVHCGITKTVSHNARAMVNCRTQKSVCQQQMQTTMRSLCYNTVRRHGTQTNSCTHCQTRINTMYGGLAKSTQHRTYTTRVGNTLQHIKRCTNDVMITPTP